MPWPLVLVAGVRHAARGTHRASDQRQPLLAAGQVLVAAAYGVLPAPRAGRATRRRPAPRSTGTPRVARSRIVSATIPIALRCSSTNSRSTGAPWPGTTTVAERDRPEHDVEGERPLHRVAVGAEPGHARCAASTPRPGRRPAARRRRAPGPPGRRRCGRGRGGPARPAGRRGRAPPPRRTSCPRARSRWPAPRRGAGRRRCRARRTAALIRSPAGTVRSAATSWACTGTAPYAARKAPLPKVWSKCSWVLTTATTSPAPSARTSSITSRAATADAWVSTTSSPAEPRTRVTLTSNHS